MNFLGGQCVLSIFLLLWAGGAEAYNYSRNETGLPIANVIPDCSVYDPLPCNYTYSTDENGKYTFQYYLETCDSHDCLQIAPVDPPPPPPRVRRPPPHVVEEKEKHLRARAPPSRNFVSRASYYRSKNLPPSYNLEKRISDEEYYYENEDEEEEDMEEEEDGVKPRPPSPSYGNGTGMAFLSPPKVSFPMSPKRRRGVRPSRESPYDFQKSLHPGSAWFCGSKRVGYKAKVQTGTPYVAGKQEDIWARCQYLRAISLNSLMGDSGLTRYGGFYCWSAYKNFICAMAFPKCQPSVSGYVPPTGVTAVFGPDTLTPEQQANVSHVITKPCRTLCYQLIRNCPALMDFNCHLKESQDFADYPACNVAGNPAGGALYV